MSRTRILEVASALAHSEVKAQHRHQFYAMRLQAMLAVRK